MNDDRDRLIELLSRVNPVPTGSVASESEPSFDDILRSFDEGIGNVIETDKAPTDRPSARPTKPRWPRLAAAGAVAALAMVVAVTIDERAPTASDAVDGDTPVEQMAMIQNAVDAIDTRDYDALRETFGARGEVTGPFDFQLRASCCGAYSIDSVDRMRAWLSLFDTWGATSEVTRCQPENAQTVRCAVVTSFEVLSMEWPADWAFVFEPGGKLRSLIMTLGDLDAEPQSQPFGYYDLREGWAAWLEEAHPDQAERLLGSTTGGEFGHEVDGIRVDSPVLWMDPVHALEIGESIEEYRRRR